MTEKKEWMNLRIEYIDETVVLISRNELEKLSKIADVIDALAQAREWAKKFQHLIREKGNSS